MASATFTGYRRTRKTKPRVIFIDRITKGVISVAGIGVIAAVFLVFIFLASVVIPLREKGSFVPYNDKTLTFPSGETPEFLAVDEFLTSGFIGLQNGEKLLHFRTDTGEILAEHTLFLEQPTALSYDSIGGWIAAGFRDGSTQLGRIYFETAFFEPGQLGEEYQDLSEGELKVLDGNTAQMTPAGQIRVQNLAISLEPRILPDNSGPILLIDQTVRSQGPVFVTLDSNGILSLRSISKKTNLLTGGVTTTAEGIDFSIPGITARGTPKFLLLNYTADTVYILWESGAFLRVDMRNLNEPKIAEEGSFFTDSSLKVTAARMLLGKSTILVGDNRGRITTWYLASGEQTQTSDGVSLMHAHTFEGPAPVTSLQSSSRKRIVAAGYADGSIRAFYVTSERQIAGYSAPDQHSGDTKVKEIVISPKDDLVGVITGNDLRLYKFDPAYPEASLKGLFSKVSYEGSPVPEHQWQSSGGTDHFEPKYGMIPIIFGTLKATFYSLLFAVPIAILAAIYTSEFLQPATRSLIKPAIEMMASLPSVVLGFLAALVFAPFTEKVVPSILAAFFTIPFAFILTGYIVQILPRQLFIRISNQRFLWMMGFSLPLGFLLAVLGGPLVEEVLFYGDLKGWLSFRVGTGAPGWFILLMPISLGVSLWILQKFVRPYLEKHSVDTTTQQGVWELGKFALGTLLTILISSGLARLLTVMGLDSRMPFPLIGSVLGTYVQRNTLVVGFMLGFSIIPIIYTLSDDSLNSVPHHLRAAALATGATPWQTTIRVVIPTAMSGLFSAVMIGLGRAVGETMIVLMATGNTPVMEWNIFNGFRTLAANIAVELPEAVVGSTHYRILFLAALILFLITFVVNTVAEVIRLRFRKRAFEL